jgi:alkaline phosphatase D
LTGARAALAADASRGLFRLGVASGDPDASSVVLWTRLAPDPVNGGGMSPSPVIVQWRVATDPEMRHVVRRGSTTARAELAHSVHVVVDDLEDERDYWYQFRAEGELSPVGHTRLLPEPDRRVRAMTFAVANCQDFQNGYWPGYGAMAAEDLDFVLHVGDFIYEYDPNSVFTDRLHTTPETLGLDQLRTLSDYRNRHALYRTDPQLQSALAAHAFFVVPDDHEVENNYANLIDEIDDRGAQIQDPATFARQRAAAYQAYYEHMPLRPSSRPVGPAIQLYRGFRFGRLAEISLLDTRQYRTDQPGGFPNDFGPVAFGAGNAGGTLTGDAQEAWLLDRLSRSHRQWNVIAQQTMVAQTKFLVPPGVQILNLDQWDGYGPFRRRLLGQIAASGASNPVVISGDIHSSWVNDLKVDFDDAAAPVVATEFVSTSLSSDFPAAFVPLVTASNALLNPHVKYFDGTRHGYIRATVTGDEWRSDFRTSTTIATRDAPTTTSSSWVIESGLAGAHPA